jgi:hypothetical protein
MEPLTPAAGTARGREPKSNALWINQSEALFPSQLFSSTLERGSPPESAKRRVKDLAEELQL